MFIKLKLILNNNDKEKLNNTIKEFNNLHKVLFDECKNKKSKFKDINYIYKELRTYNFPTKLIDLLFLTVLSNIKKGISEINYLPVNYNIISIKHINKLSLLTLSGRILCEYRFIEYIDDSVNKLELIDDEYYVLLDCK